MRWGFVIVIFVFAGIIVLANYDTFFPSDTLVGQPDPVQPEPVVEEVEQPDRRVEQIPPPEPEPLPKPPEPIEVQPEPEPVIEEDNTLKTFLEAGSKKYNGFGYWVDEIGIGAYGIAQRGDRIFIKFKRIQNLNERLDDYTVDTMVIYRENQSAIGTCLSKGCASSYKKVFDVDYNKWNPETIIDYIEQYHSLNVKSEEDSILLSDHDASVVTLQNGIRIHIDKKTRFPLVVEDKNRKVLNRVDGIYFEVTSNDPFTLDSDQKFEFS